MIRVSQISAKFLTGHYLTDTVPHPYVRHQCLYCAQCRSRGAGHYERAPAAAREHATLLVPRGHQPGRAERQLAAAREVLVGAVDQSDVAYVSACQISHKSHSSCHMSTLSLSLLPSMSALSRLAYLFAQLYAPPVSTFGCTGSRQWMHPIAHSTSSLVTQWRSPASWSWSPNRRCLWLKSFALSS